MIISIELYFRYCIIDGLPYYIDFVELLAAACVKHAAQRCCGCRALIKCTFNTGSWDQVFWFKAVYGPS